MGRSCPGFRQSVTRTWAFSRRDRQFCLASLESHPLGGEVGLPEEFA